MRRRMLSAPAHLQRGSSSPNLGNDPQNMQAMMGMFGTMMERMMNRSFGPTALDNGATLTFAGGSPGPVGGSASWALPGSMQSAFEAGSGAATGRAPHLLSGLPALPALEMGGSVGGVVAGAEATRDQAAVPMDTTKETPAPQKTASLKKKSDEAAQALMKAISQKKASAEAKKKAEKETKAGGGEEAAHPVLTKRAAAKPPAAVNKKPSGEVHTLYHDEPTRSQILCRCGKGPGSTKTFKYSKHGGVADGSKAKAIEKAKAWCLDKQKNKK